MHSYKMRDIDMPTAPNGHVSTSLSTQFWVEELLQFAHIVVFLLNIKLIIKDLCLFLLLFLHLLLAV